MISRGAIAALLLTTAAQAADLPVRGVTLSSAGLAQIERGGVVDAADPAVTFRVPLDDVDDILRSLIVADPAGRLEGVRLPAQDLAAEAFRGLPVRPDDFASRASLLNALRGQRVAIGAIEGRIGEAADGKDATLRLSLLTATGLRSVTLTDADEVRMLDPDLAARLARAAEAVAESRTADTRQVSVALRPGATAPREIGLSYVAGAPLWKPSWRFAAPAFGAPMGEARLMGWAVVENHTGSDWSGIRLSLVSGEAAAFRQRLYTPVLLPRRELPVLGSGQVDVRPDTGGRPVPPPPPSPAMAPMAAARVRAAESVMQEAERPAAEADAVASLGRVAFTLVDPVTIRAGETANVPFFDGAIQAERVWWVQGLGGRHPLQAVRLRNQAPYPLPGGLATIYGSDGAEAGGFLGDAELPALPIGEQRILAFARDTGVQYTVAQAGTSTPIGVALARGAVLTTWREVHTVTLAVDSRGVSGPIMVDLPARRGETPRFTPAMQGDFGLRVEARLPGPPTNLDWSWERSQVQRQNLWDVGLAEPLPPSWRDLSLDRDLARLPGGGADVLTALRQILARLAADAPGRADLAGVIDDYAEARRLVDLFRTAARAHATAEAALARARRAYDDRTGPEREQARLALNAASVTAGTAGAEADRAWLAWRAAAQRVVTRAGGAT